MPRLSQQEVSARLETLKGWVLDGETLVKKFKFPDFCKAMEFVKKVADAADEQKHHPTIVITYSRVTLALTTHSEGGLTEGDFKLATRIDTFS